MTPEKIVQNKVVTYFKKLEKEGKPVYVERRQAGGFSYKMGIADLYAVVDGIHIEIEVKRHGGQLRPMQEKWRDICNAKHILWFCVNDDNFNELDEIVQTILQK